MSDDRLAEITAIVRERYETGAYGDCHLRVADDVLDAVRALTTHEAEPKWRMPDGMGQMLGIPLVRDDTLPAGGWQLVQWTYSYHPPFARTETVLKAGLLGLDIRGMVAVSKALNGWWRQ